MNHSFILSTGRTGTKFFSEYLSNTDGVVCLHEPRPSRRFKLISNLYLASLLTDNQVVKCYDYSRRRILRKFQSVDAMKYIESNNFLFGCMRPIAEKYGNIKVLHIVREPFSYIKSHLGHGFWVGNKRLAARFLPFWLEALDRTVLNSGNPSEILAHRWIYVNEVISSHAAYTDYFQVRFEDIFNAYDSVRLSTMSQIRSFLDLNEIVDDSTLSFLGKAVNKSSIMLDRNHLEMSERTRKILIKAASEYGYQY